MHSVNVLINQEKVLCTLFLTVWSKRDFWDDEKVVPFSFFSEISDFGLAISKACLSVEDTTNMHEE